MRSARRSGSVSSSGPVTEATVAGGPPRSGPSGAPCPQPVEERATHQYPDRLAEPGDVVDGLGERQPHVVIAVVVLHPQPHAVPVESERPDPAAPQCRRQPVWPAGRPRRGGRRRGAAASMTPSRRTGRARACSNALTPTASAPVESATTTDSTSSRISVSRVSPSAAVCRVHLQQCGIGVLGGDQIEQSGHLCVGDSLHAPADPHQRPHRLAQRKRRIVGHLEHGLHAAAPAATTMPASRRRRAR